MKRILVLGLGGVGGYIGAKLALHRIEPDSELIFVARGPHLAAIRDHGLRYRSPDGKEYLGKPTKITDDPQSLEPVDCIFLAVKGFDLDTACRAVQPLTLPSTVILAPMNGVDIYARVKAQIPQAIVLPSSIYISSSILEPGLVCHVSGQGNLALGRDPQRPEFDPSWLNDILTNSQIPFEWFGEPFAGIWNKYLFIAAFSLVCGMSGRCISEVVKDAELSGLVRGIQREIAQLAQLRGIALDADSLVRAFERGKHFPDGVQVPFQRDLATPGAPHEGELFGGTILAMAKESGIAAPVTEQVYGAILARY